MIAPKVAPVSARAEKLAYQLVTERDGDRCQRCLRDCGAVQRDHRQNRSQGGLTVVEGLQLLGARCHQWKTDNPRAAVEQGWAVPGWARPEQFPACRWVRDGVLYRKAWVLYNSIGTWVEITGFEADRRIDGDWPQVRKGS